MLNPTKGQEVAADVAALLRARNSLIWIVTREEARVERLLVEAAASASYSVVTWDCGDGCVALDKAPVDGGGTDPGEALAAIRNHATKSTKLRRVWIMRDLHAWLAGPIGVATLRQLRNLARLLPGVERERAQAIVVLSPSGEIPPELSGHATVIDWPLPDRAEIAAILDAAIDGLPEFETDPATGQPDTTKPLRAAAAPNGTRDAAIDAAVGLTGEEAASCYSRSLVQLRRIDPAAVAKEKRRVISRERVIEWFDPLPGGLDAVGGLENLKTWLMSRAAAYTPKAREYGLPMPKGAFLVGVQGCGKSLTAKAIATAWSCPLLKVDLGALKAKYVGESEKNLRKVFDVIGAIGRCVVWFDEIEKAMAGATQGAADGGVSADALGAVLTWMQERRGEAFVIATANTVEDLPPELLRKGRFDDVWFVDLPNRVERVEILRAAVRANGRDFSKLDPHAIVKVIDATDTFTGSEIAELVPDALYRAFADGAREITTEDLIAAAKTFVPLAQTAAEKIKKLRAWADGRARPATAKTELTTAARDGRALDI